MSSTTEYERSYKRHLVIAAISTIDRSCLGLPLTCDGTVKGR